MCPDGGISRRRCRSRRKRGAPCPVPEKQAKEKAEKRVRRLRETLAKFVIQVRSAEKSWQSLFSGRSAPRRSSPRITDRLRPSPDARIVSSPGSEVFFLSSPALNPAVHVRCGARARAPKTCGETCCADDTRPLECGRRVIYERPFIAAAPHVRSCQMRRRAGRRPACCR